MNENMYPIGVVAKKTGMTLRALRFYEQRKLVQPHRLHSGTRLYTDTDVRDLKIIARYTNMGFTLAEIATLLELCTFEELDTPTGWVVNHLTTKMDIKRGELLTKRDEIEQQLEALSTTQRQW